MILKKLSFEERPRERLSIHGVKTLTTSEILAIILGSGTQNLNALELAKKIIKRYGLIGLNMASQQELQCIKGIGLGKACSIVAAIEFGKRIQQYKGKLKSNINNPKEAFMSLRDDLSYAEQEKLICLFLNCRDKLIEKKTIFIGTIDRQLISTREIVKNALALNATKVIIAHNHPSGEVLPSSQDKKATKLIQKSLNYFDIELADHLILSGNEYFSFRKEGLIL